MYILRLYNQICPLLSNVCRTTQDELRIHKLYLEYLLKEYEYSIELAFRDNGTVKEFMDGYIDSLVQKEREKIAGLSFDEIENMLEDDDALDKLTELSNQIFEQARRKKFTGTFNTNMVYTTMEVKVLSLYENIRRLNKPAATKLFNETLLDLKYLYNKGQKESERLTKETNKEVGLIDTVLSECKQNGLVIHNELEVRDVLVRLYSRYKDLTDDYKYAICLYYVYAVTNEGNSQNTRVDVLNSLLSWDIEHLKDKVAAFKWKPCALKEIMKLSNAIFEKAKDAYLFYKVSTTSEIDELLEKIIQLGNQLKSETYLYREKDEILGIYAELLKETRIDVETCKGNREVQSKRLGVYLEDMSTMSFLSVETSKDIAS